MAMVTAAATTTTTPLRMKLLVDTRTQRVLFAEASKEVVDILFSFLVLPVGTVVMLLGRESVVGSVSNLYGSVENLERSYVQPSVDMDALLRPVVLPPAAGSITSVFRLQDASARPRCPCCDRPRSGEGQSRREHTQTGYGSDGRPYTITFPTLDDADIMRPATTAAGGGFVRGNMTYTVMDDLTIAPMSTISTISAFHTMVSVFNTMTVRDMAEVQERTVLIGYTEALKILKASFESKTVLTDVFVSNRALPAR